MGAIGLGTTISIGSAVSGVESISGPNLSLDMEEITNLGSSDGWEEFIGGVLRTGEVTLTINWVPATHKALIAHMVARAEQSCEITWPDNTTSIFTAFVQAVSPTAGTGKMTATITLKPTGAATGSLMT